MDPHVNMVGHRSSAEQIPHRSKYYNPNDWPLSNFKEKFWEAPKVEGRCMNVEDMDSFMEINHKVCKGLLEDTVYLNALRDRHFDIAIHEIYDYCVVAVLEMIGIKNTIVVSAVGVTSHVQDIAGFPTNPSFIPG
ncbi:unnamed protein product, partial [Cylicostephanus goldi]